MRLLLVTHFMPPHHGGIERVAQDHAIAAHDAGHDVTWVASRMPRDAAACENTSWGRAVRIACWNPFERLLGVPYPLWSPRARRQIDAVIADRDLVHVHDVLYPGTSLALAAARRRGIPALVTQHVGFVPYRWRFLESLQRLAYRTRGRQNAARATAIAYLNPRVRHWLESTCRSTVPAHHLPNGVDVDRFHPVTGSEERSALKRRHGLAPDRPVILFVGRLVARKGANLLVQAAPRGCDLLLVGDRGAIDVVPTSDDVVVEQRPFVDHHVLAEIMRAVDVVGLPSVGEGFPLVAQEAMASGVPVLLGDDEGYRQQLDPGSAVLVEPQIEAVRTALRRLLASADEREAIGRRARICAVERWSQAACRARLLDLYGALVDGRPGASTTTATR